MEGKGSGAYKDLNDGNTLP
jgi:hypothetical protein